MGYRVEGHKQTARLVPDETIVWGTWSAARLVQRIYEWLALEGKSCRWVAQELNLLGVPTAYQRAGRGVRGRTTQALWRPGRIRNLVVNPTYKGVLRYGRRRSKKSKRTQVIEAPCPAIVSPELWQAAQRALSANRILAKDTGTVYLLRGVMKCGLCGLSYVGSRGRPGVFWYRCNGYLAERGGKDHRCQARSVRSSDIEPVIWRDIESFLRAPGALIDQLRGEADGCLDDAAALLEAERITLQTARADLELRRQRVLDLYERGRVTPQELDCRLDEVERQRKEVESRLAGLQVPEPAEAPLDADLLEEVRARLDAGLTPEQRSEVVRLLVRRITVHTRILEDGRKEVRLVVEYRFSVPRCSQARNGRGSWPPPA